MHNQRDPRKFRLFIGIGLSAGICLVLFAIMGGAVIPVLAAPQAANPQAAAASQKSSTSEARQPPAPLEASGSEWGRWTSGRYRISPGDVLEVKFPFVAELDQTLTVQPDGYVALREIGDVRVQGLTVPELRSQLSESYEPIVRDPVFTVTLKEFERPYFVAAGEINKPGRYDLRGATTLTQALAYAGGPTFKARMSEVVIFRYHTEDTVTTRQVDVKSMYAKRDLTEDPLLRPGDTIYLPKSTLGTLAPILSRLGVGLYLNPLDFLH